MFCASPPRLHGKPGGGSVRVEEEHCQAAHTRRWRVFVNSTSALSSPCFDMVFRANNNQSAYSPARPERKTEGGAQVQTHLGISIRLALAQPSLPPSHSQITAAAAF